MNNKHIIVYWGSNTKEWMRAEEPLPIFKKLISNNAFKDVELNRCPAFKDYMSNMYGTKSIYSYNFSVTENGISTDSYNQDFFNEHLDIRSIEHKAFSFNQKLVFFTEEKSLKISTGILPSFEQNEITKRCMTVPGVFDIGRWFRQTDFAFYLKEEYDSFSIKEKDIFQYIKFHTDKKIIFKQFYIDDFLNKQLASVDAAKFNRPNKFRELEEYYNMFKNKNNIIKRIKENLV